MQLDIAVFPTDRSMPIDQLAVAVEERGFGALWVTEHTHIPVHHSPFPAGGELPEMYKRTLDPLVALTAAAAVTDRIGLATGVCLVAQHDPIVLAKQIATLDLLSAGRVILGVGFGWNRPELEHHGVAFPDRRAVVRERVLAMRALWGDEVASFDGEHVQLAPSWMWPKPVQQPGPPIVLGARFGPRTLDDLVAYADGWMPIGARGLAEDLPEVRRRLEAAGRDPDSFQVIVYGSRPDPDLHAHLASLGVHRVAHWVPSVGAADTVRVLDELAALVSDPD